MKTPTFEQYLAYRQQFSVSRELAVDTLSWAEPLARDALGVHSERDQLQMGEGLHYIPVLTTPEENGGWGELMPVWFKPYERPLPIFILNNWAMFALLWQYWLGDIGPAFNRENLLKIFLGGDLLIPFLPKIQGGGSFLRQGSFTMLLGLLWLDPPDIDSFMAGIKHGASRFADEYHLRGNANSSQTVDDALKQIEFEAIFLAEASKIAGDAQIRAFLANELQFKTYAALFGGLSLSLAALYDWYGANWREWIFQKVNVDYRLATFGLEAWAKWLEIEYTPPLPNPETVKMFRADNKDG